MRHRRRGRAAARSARRGAARAGSSIRPTPPKLGVRSAAPSPPMPAGRAASSTAPRAAGWRACAWCWPMGRHAKFRRGDAIDFDPGADPAARGHQEHRRLPAAARAWIGWICSCGSEGTLGVVTEARVRLLPAPTAVLGRRDLLSRRRRSALDAVEAWRAHRAAHARIPRRAFARSLRARFPRSRRKPRVPRCCSSRNWHSETIAGSGRVARPHRSRRRAARGARGSPLSARRPRALPPVPPRPAGVGERHRPPHRRAQNEYRLRRAAGAQSRDAGVLPARPGTPNFRAGT